MDEGKIGLQQMPMHFLLQFALVLAYQFTPFKIEWVGLVVIGLYITVFVRMAMELAQVRRAVAETRAV